MLGLGRIASMELNHVPVDTARAGQAVAMKIEATNASESSRLYGRHFDHKVFTVPNKATACMDQLRPR